MSRPNSSAPRRYLAPGRARFSKRLCFAGSWGASQGANAADAAIRATMRRPISASRFRRNRRHASPTSVSARSATGASVSTAVLIADCRAGRSRRRRQGPRRGAAPEAAASRRPQVGGATAGWNTGPLRHWVATRRLVTCGERVTKRPRVQREPATGPAAARPGPRSSEHPVTAVDADRLAGDVPGVLGREEHHRAGDVLRLAEAPERDALDQSLLAGLAHRLPLALRRGVRADEARRHAVDADAELAELARRLAGEPDQPRLGAGVGL